MENPEQYLQGNRIPDPEDVDSLLEFASLTRQLLEEGRYPDLSRLLRRTVESGCGEALTWFLEILQEKSGREDFSLSLGRSVPDFNGFVSRLQAEPEPLRNDVEKVYDGNGEVESFYNILTYRTAYPNVFLVSSENFDTKDNDFIRYELRFVRS